MDNECYSQILISQSYSVENWVARHSSKVWKFLTKSCAVQKKCGTLLAFCEIWTKSKEIKDWSHFFSRDNVLIGNFWIYLQQWSLALNLKSNNYRGAGANLTVRILLSEHQTVHNFDMNFSWNIPQNVFNSKV